jgi:hypothetical protein
MSARPGACMQCCSRPRFCLLAPQPPAAAANSRQQQQDQIPCGMGGELHAMLHRATVTSTCMMAMCWWRFFCRPCSACPACVTQPFVPLPALPGLAAQSAMSLVSLETFLNRTRGNSTSQLRTLSFHGIPHLTGSPGSVVPHSRR